MGECLIFTDMRSVRLLLWLIRETDQVPERKPISGDQLDGLSADVSRCVFLYLCIKRSFLWVRTTLILTPPSYLDSQIDAARFSALVKYR